MITPCLNAQLLSTLRHHGLTDDEIQDEIDWIVSTVQQKSFEPEQFVSAVMLNYAAVNNCVTIGNFLGMVGA